MMCRSGIIFRVMVLWTTILIDLNDAFAVVKPYAQVVTNWLDREGIAWHLLHESDVVFPKQIISQQPILEIKSYNGARYYLHILKSPVTSDECISPTCTRDMTNYIQHINNNIQQQADQNDTKISLIHLHEDVWHAKESIVKSRLRIRLLGPSKSSRIYARKTKVKRIDAGTAIPFLYDNHMWGATKARYYYGLYLPSSSKDSGQRKEDALVAVATFSTKRKIKVGSAKLRSSELLRFCTRANDVVVGGISKLIRAFTNNQKELDYIVTVVDRDWGPGDNWHSTGFNTLHVMSPLFMAVKDDGVRRHLVGAGVATKTTNKSALGRLGVEDHVLEELEDATNHEEALSCLERNEYYPVYDAGVERLVLSLSSDDDIQKTIIPSYGATYSSTNTGVSLLLSNVVANTAASVYNKLLSVEATTLQAVDQIEIRDSITAQDDMNSWRASGKTAKNTTLLYKAPSSLDSQATVEVRERDGGWCTLGIVGGATKSIRHGTFLQNDDGKVEPRIMVSEYLRSMAAIALTALEFQRILSDDDGTRSSTRDKEAAISCLHIGYGAGSLPRYMADVLKESEHVALELDDGVVSAAHACGLSNNQIRLELGDALAYQLKPNADPYDIIFVDVFDEENLLPPEFFTQQYLRHMQQNYLGDQSSGIVVHNFHTGGKLRGKILEDALKSYRRVFPCVFAVESIGSSRFGGNVIAVAINSRRLDASSETLTWYEAGKKAQQRNVEFDIVARSTNKLWLS